MAILRDRQIPAAQEPWYPDNGVTNKDQALAAIVMYFPQILAVPNSVGSAFKKARDIELVPAKDRQDFELFIARADNHYLRYYLERTGQPSWHLQYYVGHSPNITFALLWEGAIGYGSEGVHGNFVNVIDFGYRSVDNTFGLKSQGGGKWSTEVKLSSPGADELLFLRSKALLDSLKDQRQKHIGNKFDTYREYMDKTIQNFIIFRSASRAGNLLVLDIKGSQGDGQIAIPATVTPARFV